MPLRVRLGDGRTEEWTLELERDAHVSCHMRLVSPDARTWTAEDSDTFGCLCIIRNQIEPDGLRLCCNGSRRDAWLSGMLRDMGDGRNVYLMDTSQAGGPDGPEIAPMLDFAPADDVVSLREQLDWVGAILGWETPPSWPLRTQ